MRDTEIFPLRGEAHHPWHLHAGVVLVGENGRIPLVRDSEGSYQLPRATLATDENFISCIHRLVLDTVRVVPTLSGYLGSVTTLYRRYDGSTIEKTALYFEASFRSPYHGRFSAPGLYDDGLTWVTLGEAYDLLSLEPHGEETIIERVGAEVAHALFAA